MPLGRLLGALGRLSGSLGRFLGSSWVLLGRSWASLSSSRTPLGRILPPQDLPNLDFGGSGNVLGWFLQGFGAVFGHAFCCVSRFVISRGHNLSLVIATPFLPHACALCTTFLTQCLHFGTSCFYWCSNHELALTTALCFLSFWCGGLCAAHGIRRTAGSAQACQTNPPHAGSAQACQNNVLLNYLH